MNSRRDSSSSSNRQTSAPAAGGEGAARLRNLMEESLLRDATQDVEPALSDPTRAGRFPVMAVEDGLVTSIAPDPRSSALPSRVDPPQRRDGSDRFAFRRSWYNPIAVWRAFRPRPLFRRDENALTVLQATPSHRVWQEEYMYIDHDRVRRTRALHHEVERVISRMQQYVGIVRALSNYFSSNVPNMEPISTAPLRTWARAEVQESRTLAIQERLWEYQGYIRWIATLVPDWRSLPLGLPSSWVSFIESENLLSRSMANIGTVVDFRSGRDDWPNVAWYLAREVTIDWLWTDELNQEEQLRPLNPFLRNDVVHWNDQGVIPLAAAVGGVPSTSTPSTTSEPVRSPVNTTPQGVPRAPRYPVPPGGSRWDDRKYKRKDFSSWWLWSRLDTSQVPVGKKGNLEYRYGIVINFKCRHAVAHYDFRPHWPRHGCASWITHDYDMDQPTHPDPDDRPDDDYDDYDDDDDYIPMAGTGGGGGAPLPPTPEPSPPTAPITLPPPPQDQVPVVTREEEEERVDYEWTSDEEFEPPKNDESSSKGKGKDKATEEEDAVEAPPVFLSPEEAEEIEAEHLRQATNASLQETCSLESRITDPSRAGPSTLSRFGSRGGYLSQREEFYRSRRSRPRGARQPSATSDYDRRGEMVPLNPRRSASPIRTTPTTNLSWSNPTSDSDMNGWGSPSAAEGWSTTTDSGWTVDPGATGGWASLLDLPEATLTPPLEQAPAVQTTIVPASTEDLPSLLPNEPEPNPVPSETVGVDTVPRRKTLFEQLGQSLESRLSSEDAPPPTNDGDGSLPLDEIERVVRQDGVAQLWFEEEAEFRDVPELEVGEVPSDGHLILPPSTALRAYLRHQQDPSRGGRDFVPYALRSGLPFEWSSTYASSRTTQDSDVEMPAGPVEPMVVDEAQPTEAIGELEPGEIMVVDEEHDRPWWEEDSAEARQAARVRAIERILRQPQGVHALYCGGILWRIALAYGGEELLRRAVRGPPNDSRPLTVEEERVLTGEMPDGTSVYPSDQIFRSSALWDGEWSVACERWWRRRGNDLRGRPDHRYAPERWLTSLRSMARTPKRQADGVGSEAWLDRIRRILLDLDLFLTLMLFNI